MRGVRHWGAVVCADSELAVASQIRRVPGGVQRVVAPPAGDPMWWLSPRAAEPLPTRRPLVAELVAVSRPQRERPDRCVGSGHGQSPVMGTWGGGASDFRLHPMYM